ncbi:phage capsid protein [Rhizobium sp. PAMB 3182]
MAVENWFREIIRDKVRIRYQAMGGYLDETMSRGDGGAGSIKFPVVGGVIQMYELTGALQEIDASGINLDMVEVSIRDFEAAAYLRIQDTRKMGPSQQDALAKLMARAVRLKRDRLKLDVLDGFATAGATTLTDTPTTIETIGDGTKAMDIETAVYLTDVLKGAGSDEDLFCPLPHAQFSQLMMYKQFSNSQYAGPADLPFAKAGKVRMKTFQDVHFMALPNELFAYGTGAYGTGSGGKPFDDSGYLDLYAWAKDAAGSEIEWDQENMSMDPQPQLKGTPTLCKVQLSGNAVGLLPEGIKKVRVKAINMATDPTV